MMRRMNEIEDRKKKKVLKIGEDSISKERYNRRKKRE